MEGNSLLEFFPGGKIVYNYTIELRTLGSSFCLDSILALPPVFHMSWLAMLELMTVLVHRISVSNKWVDL